MLQSQSRLLFQQSKNITAKGLQQYAHQNILPKRSISNWTQDEPTQTMLQQRAKFKKLTSDMKNKLKGLSLEKLHSLVPTNQKDLMPRTMKDSWDSIIIPLQSDSQLRLKYLSLGGGLRIGRLLEDMDYFAAMIAFSFSKNEKDGFPVPIVHVTALVDHIDFQKGVEMKIDQDIKIEGYVSWVGRSSVQININVLQRHSKGKWVKAMQAVFCNVARNPVQNTAAVINPLICETDEERELFKEGEKRNQERKVSQGKALFIAPPNKQEKELVHDLLMKMANPAQFSFSLKNKPDNSIWMKDAKMKNIISCFMENRNLFGKIFGGFLMREAFEVAYANASIYSRQVPKILHIDDILFRVPVDVGSMLFLSSQVVFTEKCYVQISTKASVYDVFNKVSNMTNIFHFTFQVPKPVPICLPHSYQEAMMYLDGRRHFQQVQTNFLGN